MITLVTMLLADDYAERILTEPVPKVPDVIFDEVERIVTDPPLAATVILQMTSFITGMFIVMANERGQTPLEVLQQYAAECLAEDTD